MREDRQILMLTHLSQLFWFIAPLIIWIVNKDKIYGMDEQGKQILNFQFSMFIYGILCVPLILLIGLGFLGLIAIGIMCFIFPIINAIKVNNGERPNYPFTMEFLR